MKTKIEIIEETAAFYNSTNRAFNGDNGGCKYHTPDGRACAVGRCLIDPEKIESISERAFITKECPSTGFDDLFNCGFVKMEDLKEEYRVDDIDFWLDLQRFHDYAENFTDTGLTERGIRKKNELMRKYSASRN